MKQLKKRAADRLTLWFGAQGGGRSVCSALVLMVAASVAGSLLAAGVSRWSSRLQNSEIISELTKNWIVNSDQSKGALESPQNPELFFAYLNALAPAVNEIAVLPGRQIGSFTVLQTAAGQTGCELLRFWMEDKSTAALYLAIAAPSLNAANAFTALVQNAHDFSAAELLDQPDLQEYTIRCTFSPLF